MRINTTLKVCLLFFMSTVVLCACDNGQVSQGIQRGPGGDTGGDPTPKPTAPFSNRVLLALSGFGQIGELLNTLAHSPAPAHCIQKSKDRIEWNCRESKELHVGQRGFVDWQTSSGQTTLITPSQGLDSWVLQSGRMIRGRHHIDLQLNGQRLTAATSFEYTHGTPSRGVRYILNWEVSALLNPAIQEVGTSQFSSADLLLTITRQDNSGAKTNENVFQYRIIASQPITIDHCGRTLGAFTFSGYQQPELAVIADSEQGLKSEKGGTRHLFPTCHPQLNGLNMSAPFWLRPEP
jgi:hypothetical protein